MNGLCECRHLILVRGDDIYEAVGFDAVICMEILGRGSSVMTNPPRIKYPIQRIDEAVDRLIREGFVVVMCEKSAGNDLEWFVSQMVSPAKPCYLHRPNDDDATDGILPDGAYELSAPIVGVVSGKEKYTMLEFWAAKNVVEIRQELSQEEIWARVQSSGFSPPLYIHELCLKRKKRGRSKQPLSLVIEDWEREMSKLAPLMTSCIQVFHGTAAQSKFLGIVKDIMGYPADKLIATIEKNDTSLRKPSFNTISQLGLVEEVPGLVSLGDVLVPKGTPKSISRLIQRFLMAPPPLNVCKSIHQACSILYGSKDAISELKLIPPSKVSQARHRSMAYIYTFITGCEGQILDMMCVWSGSRCRVEEA